MERAICIHVNICRFNNTLEEINMKKVLLALFLTSIMSTSAFAVPALQVYLVGGDYVGDTWVGEDPNLTIRVANAWEGNEKNNPVDRDVYLVMWTPSDEVGTIEVNGVPLVSSTPPFIGEINPSLFNHSDASGHTAHYYHIGVVSADGTTVDYGGTPIGTNEKLGHEDDLNISIEGYTYVHFDAVAKRVVGDETYVNPYSHDASYTPEPGTLALLGSGLLGLVPAFRRKRKAKTE